MSLVEKFETAAWFMHRPDHWRHACSLAVRKFLTDRDRADVRAQAGTWAESQAAPFDTIVRELGYVGAIGSISEIIGMDRLAEANARVRQCPVKMGGAGDIRLLYFACEAIGAMCVLETGVAYGWSSLAVLSSLSKRERGLLTSIDMPYPKLNNSDWVGVAVPADLREQWRLLRQPDRNGIKKALTVQKGALDLCHYDSDKSYYGRRWAYPLLWNALRPGGVFISDDIQDNFAFRDFSEATEARFWVLESQGKFVGICVKPSG